MFDFNWVLKGDAGGPQFHMTILILRQYQRIWLDKATFRYQRRVVVNKNSVASLRQLLL
jgi:hypothetical protein